MSIIPKSGRETGIFIRKTTIFYKVSDLSQKKNFFAVRFLKFSVFACKKFLAKYRQIFSRPSERVGGKFYIWRKLQPDYLRMSF